MVEAVKSQLDPPPDVQFFKNVAQVVIQRVRTDSQALGDLFVALSLRHQRHDFNLSGR